MKLRLPGVLLWLAVLGAAPAWAVEQVHDGYRARYAEEAENGVAAKLVAPDGREVATLDSLYAAHYHPFEVHQNQVFWVSRPPQLGPGWTDALRVTDLATGKARTLYSVPGLDFRADAQGRTAEVIACNGEGACALHLLDVGSGQERQVYASEDSALAPLGLSRDGSKVWFGKADGPAGHWMQLGLYENGKVRFFPIPEREDQAIDFETGRVASAQKRGGTVLLIDDAFSGKRTEVARKARGAFKPQWNPDGSLTYVDAKGKTARYMPPEAGAEKKEPRRATP